MPLPRKSKTYAQISMQALTSALPSFQLLAPCGDMTIPEPRKLGNLETINCSVVFQQF